MGNLITATDKIAYSFLDKNRLIIYDLIFDYFDE